MATLTVWKFDSPTAADETVATLEKLAQQELIKVHDAATVSWAPGAKKPKTRQLRSLTGTGALGGMFWGMLFGLLFFVPFFGMAIGAAMGALMGKFADYGIDDAFIKGVQQEVTPGSSALFLLSQSSAPERVIDAVKAAGLHPTLIASNLSQEQEASLREDFALE